MHAVSSRPYTPSQSPPHSGPVRIPPAAPTDLHVANALRYKHLYGYTQGSSSSWLASQDSDSTCSEAEYEDYVVKIHSEIVVDERDGNSISDNDISSSLVGSPWRSPPLSPLANSIAVSRAVGSSSSKIMSENIEHLSDGEDQALTPRMTPCDAVSDLVAPVSDNFSLAEMECPPVLPGLVINEGPSSSRAGIDRPLNSRAPTDTRRRHLRASPQPVSSQDQDEEFRCITCHHARLCADLVMKDPNFRCGDTISSGARPRGSSVEEQITSGAGGKTPWTRQNLKNINFGKKQNHQGEKDRNRLRVLEGGIDYVNYEESDESDNPGGGRSLLDLEDIGRAIKATSSTAYDVDGSAFHRNAADDAPLLFEQQKVGIQAGHAAASPRTLYAFRSNPTSSQQNTLSPCADTIVHLEPAVNSTVNESDVYRPIGSREPEDCSPLPPPESGYERSRGRPRGNPIWKIHDPSTQLLAGNSPYGREDEARYDYDDELYGVDVVNRGRSRQR